MEVAPHEVHILGGAAPVASRIRSSEPTRLRQPALDASDSMTDLASQELQAAPLRFVIEQDSIRDEQIMGFAIVHTRPVRVDLRHSIGTTGMERRLLVLGLAVHASEHFAGRGLV